MPVWDNIKKKSRLFNKELGGGSILDLGCYPISFLNYIYKNLYNKKIDSFKISNVEKNICSTGVETEAKCEIDFEKFKAIIKCSFEKNLGQKTEIIGTDGELVIENTWTCNPSKILKLPVALKLLELVVTLAPIASAIPPNAPVTSAPDIVKEIVDKSESSLLK